MNKKRKKEEKTWIEEIEVAGSELVSRIKELIKEGNIRRLILRNQEGDLLLEIPLTAGVIVGSAFTLAAPILAALGAFAALIAKVKIEIERVEKKSKK